MQNSNHHKGSLFLRGAWLLIAGALLLGPSSVLAESYLRVWDKGVIYYYFPSREHPQVMRVPPNPQTRAPLPKAPAFHPEMDQSQNLRPLLIKAVIRMDSNRNPKATSPKGDIDLVHLRLGKANDLPVVNAYDPKKNIWMGARDLGRMLANCSYRSPLASSAYNPVSRWLDRHQALPPIQETQALVRDVCHNFLKYAQEQGADLFAGSNQFGYCFPVASPFSFRDTWGDPRSGGRVHHAVDIIACEGTPVYAITSGVIHQLATWNEAGISLILRGQDGKGYGYMHLHGYAEGIVEGKPVNKGELIAYVGRTGIQRDAPHLHLQVYADHNFDRSSLLNPYEFLVQLCDGKGVTDLLDHKMARQRIPEPEVINYATVRLSISDPRRSPGSHRRVENPSTLLTNKY